MKIMCHVNVLLTNLNISRELCANKILIMASLQNYREWLSIATFHRFHFNSKELSYLPWQSKFSNRMTNFNINPKIFSWTKIPQNLHICCCDFKVLQIKLPIIFAILLYSYALQVVLIALRTISWISDKPAFPATAFGKLNYLLKQVRYNLDTMVHWNKFCL